MSRILWLLLVATPSLAAANELPVPVQAVLSHRNVPDEALSIRVENLATGEVVLDWFADTPRTPASVMKYLTTLVALDSLGPAYTWKTHVYLRGDVENGVLDGDLVLKGYGDPYLVTERLWQLQRRLRALGISRIAGDLVLDDSYFRVGDYDPAAFDREPLRAYNVEPNALMSNYKVVRYLFTPNPAGNDVTIAMEPPLGNLQIVNRLSVRPGPCRGYQRGIAVNASPPFERFTFSGRFPAGCRAYAMDRSALSHNAYTYGLFRSLWEESGGVLEGSWKQGLASADAEPDLEFESIPLSEVITKVNKYSNNVMARQLLFTLGAEAFGPPGTEDKGRAAISAWLAERGFDFAEVKLDNGAGLSRDARITARHLAALLRYGYESRYMPELMSSLALSGTDGTLVRRLGSHDLKGVAHMKTGSLDHVSSIAGYVLGESGERYSVVVLLNHTGAHRGPGDEVQEMLLRWVRAR